MWPSCSGFYSAKLTRYLRTPACMSHPQVLMLTVFVLYAAGSHAEDSSKCERDGPETMTLRREGKTQWVHSVSQNPHHPKLDQDMGAYILTLSICVDPRKSRVYRSYGKKKVLFVCGAASAQLWGNTFSCLVSELCYTIELGLLKVWMRGQTQI